MYKINNSYEYNKYLEKINKKDSLYFKGIISYLKISITVKSEFISQDDLAKWSVVDDNNLLLNIIVLDYSRDIPVDPPTSYYDAIYLKSDDTISYCDTIGDYNWGSDVRLGDIGLLDKYKYNENYDSDICILKIKRLKKYDINYYLDLMSRFNISRKKYFEYKDRLQEAETNEILEKKEHDKNIKSIITTIFYVLIIFIFLDLFL